MNIHKFDFWDINDSLCKKENYMQEIMLDPLLGLHNLGTACLHIAPSMSTELHKHHECEVIFVISGHGVFTNSECCYDIVAGQVITLAPFDRHSIVNRSNSKALTILCLYWNDFQLQNNQLTQLHHDNPRKITIITSTPPTPNGDLHLGHISGPYLGADLFKRYLRLKGYKAYHLTGQDDHQSHTEFKATSLSLATEALAQSYGEAIQKTLKANEIEIDYFNVIQNNHDYKTIVKQLFHKLLLEEKLIIQESPVLYCNNCNLYLYEVYVIGQCMHCGAISSGAVCEECGFINDSIDLIEPRCKCCSSKPTISTLKRVFFPISKYKEQIIKYHERVFANNYSLRILCSNMLEHGLQSIPVSHDAKLGIPVDLPGCENQIISVWFEMGLGHLAVFKSFSDSGIDYINNKDIWFDKTIEIVQFFGFDNTYFNTILFPATFYACYEHINLPKALIMNKFLLLDNLKFSTSRNHAIWGRDLLEKYTTDLMRFYLCAIRPEHEEKNFTLSEFEHTISSELSTSWQKLLQLVDEAIKNFSYVVPNIGLWTDEQHQFFNDLTEYNKKVPLYYEINNFSPERVIRIICDAVRTAINFNKKQQLLANNCKLLAEYRTSVVLQLTMLKFLAIWINPIMPNFSLHLWSCLGFDLVTYPIRWENNINFIQHRQKVTTLTYDFYKIKI